MGAGRDTPAGNWTLGQLSAPGASWYFLVRQNSALYLSEEQSPTWITEERVRSGAPCRFAGTAAWRLLALTVLTLGVFLLAAPGSRGQISPGPLSKAHKSLDGTGNCSSCHVFGASAPTFKCTDCHKEIAQDLAGKHGYHGLLAMTSPSGKDCVKCHLEHNGESFNLIHWGIAPERFDHALTGYKLEGKHATVACEKCHTPANFAASERDLIQKRDLTKSFMGLSANCAACHSDPHKGQLGTECAKCHKVQDWKAAKAFDHSATRFPLTGLHASVACEKCHKPDAPGGAPRFRDVPFSKCSACHSDPHRGEFKQSCESCHTAGGWQKLADKFQFDHSKTQFPLAGKHASAACTSCHIGGDFKKAVAFAKCSDCHRTGPHGGQFAERASKGECAECHSVQGWKPSLFDVKMHEGSEYPLKGKHATVACSACHIPAGKDTRYKVAFVQCTDCHKDVHAGQFAAAPYKNRCESCHTVTDFHRTTFTIAQHQETRFVLSGAHAAVPCAECHKAGIGGRSDQVLPFHFEDRTCTACHSDVHHDEFAARMQQKRPDGSLFGCEACHTTKSWADIGGFDHSKTKFPLLGAHRTVACADCHKPGTPYQSRFAGTAQQCGACHRDAHAGQFAAGGGAARCADCHNSLRWTPSTFDHNAKTRLPLTGGHANVACVKCHTQTTIAEGRTITLYKDTPAKCADCHLAGTAK